MEAEDVKHKKRKLIVDKRTIQKVDMDVSFGMFFSNLVMYFIILTAGTVLFQGGIKEITTVEQAAKALEPIAGKLSYALFALGVLGTGLLAVPVLTGCLSYMMSETFNWNGGLDKKYYEAKPFYWVIIISLLIGLAINFVGISPVKALIYTAILYGVSSPVLIGVILHMSNNKKIMGKFTNGKLSNILGVITLLLTTASAVALLYFELT
jgi:Mn2+/Fe2+ NRAMP family transporter